MLNARVKGRAYQVAIKMSPQITALLFVFSVTGATLFTGYDASAQICKPVSERTGEVGCWIIANTDLGRLPLGPIFWHLYTFATKEEANAAKGQYGTVVESLGKFWLFTVEVEGWRPSAGTHVSVIGPLPVKTNLSYSAQYMEAIFTPGMTAPTHRHSGPEAWYTISGETCLETPEGEFIGKAGGPPVIVRGGLPMHLTAIGKETRRALVLILHDSAKEPTTPAKDWTPIGLCRE